MVYGTQNRSFTSVANCDAIQEIQGNSRCAPGVQNAININDLYVRYKLNKLKLKVFLRNKAGMLNKVISFTTAQMTRNVCKVYQGAFCGLTTLKPQTIWSLHTVEQYVLEIILNSIA